jgi:hypothetical protein
MTTNAMATTMMITTIATPPGVRGVDAPAPELLLPE